MRFNRSLIAILYYCLSTTVLTTQTPSQVLIPEPMRMDLRRIEESWRILDEYGNRAWPDWSGWAGIPIRFDYPNGLSLHVGAPLDSSGLLRITDCPLAGKALYLDTSKINSLSLTSRLTFAAGGGIGLGSGHPTMHVSRGIITPTLERESDSLSTCYGKPDWPHNLSYSTDNTIYDLIHEFFHCFADFGAIRWSDDTLLVPDVNYAVFGEIEGDLLEMAAFEPDTTKTRSLVREALAARAVKRRSMSIRQQTYECDKEKSEGTAEYAAYRVTSLLDSSHRPVLTHEDDSLYFEFLYGPFFPALRRSEYLEARRSSFSTVKCYGNGFHICLILDKLLPGWKTGFFQQHKQLDELLASAMPEEPADSVASFLAIKSHFAIDSLIRQHSYSINQRDSVIDSFHREDKGYFRIDFHEMANIPIPNIEFSGRFYLSGLRRYYGIGITTVTLGDMTCNVRGVSICYEVDSDDILVPRTRGQSAETAYDLNCVRQSPDGCYYDATISTQFFTLHAGKLRLVTRPNLVEITILPTNN